MLQLTDITKVYAKGKRAVDAVTLRMEPGLLGLLGPNGAGKSSLMRVAATVTNPTSGQVLFNGQDVVAKPDLLRRVLGYLPQDFGVYPNLTAREFLRYLAAAKGLSGQVGRGTHRRADRDGQPHRGPEAAARQVLRRHVAAGGHRPGPARRSAGDHR